MSETNATRTLRTHLKAMGVHVQRIEDKLTAGIPDTNGCVSGVEFWAEGKFVKQLPARPTTLVRFGSKGEQRLALQRNWLMARQQAGGRCFWWVRVRDGGWYLFEDKFNWLVEGVPRAVLDQQENLGSAKRMAEVIVEKLGASS